MAVTALAFIVAPKILTEPVELKDELLVEIKEVLSAVLLTIRDEFRLAVNAPDIVILLVKGPHH